MISEDQSVQKPLLKQSSRINMRFVRKRLLEKKRVPTGQMILAFHIPVIFGSGFSESSQFLLILLCNTSKSTADIVVPIGRSIAEAVGYAQRVRTVVPRSAPHQPVGTTRRP